MSLLTLVAAPITREAFQHFGEIIEKDPASEVAINAGRFERFNNLATVDVQELDGTVNVSIFRCRHESALPHEFTLMERHPLGSQAFIPLSAQPFVVAVAPPGDSVDPTALRAFVTNGQQGINLFRGVWHLPLISQHVGEEFLVIDRGGKGNCDELELANPVRLQC